MAMFMAFGRVGVAVSGGKFHKTSLYTFDGKKSDPITIY